MNVADTFKVGLLNPSHLLLKITEDTPVGVIFDYNCEVVGTETSTEVDAAGGHSWLRRQTLINTSPPKENHSQTKKEPPDREQEEDCSSGVSAAIHSKQPLKEPEPAQQGNGRFAKIHTAQHPKMSDEEQRGSKLVVDHGEVRLSC